MDNLQKQNYSYKDSCSAFVLAVMMYFFVSALFYCFISIYANFSAMPTSEIASLTSVQYLNSIFCELSFLATFLFFNFLNKKQTLVASKLNKKQSIKITLVVMVLSILVLLCSMNFTGLFNQIFSTFASPNNVGGILLNNFWQFLLAVLVFALLPAICEELVFRGIILNGFASKFSKWVAVLFSASLFALMHFSIYSTIHQFLIGVVLGFVFLATENLFYPILFHFINNLSVLFIQYVFGNNFVLMINSWGTLQVLITLAVFALGVGLTIFAIKYISKSSSKFQSEKFENFSQIETLPKLENEKTQSNFALQEKKNTLLLSLTIIFCVLIWIWSSFGGAK